MELEIPMKTVLKKLERDRSLVQRELNAVVDPVSRLPLEISSEIFLLSLAADHMAREKRLDPILFSSFPKAGARRVPMLLMNVCNTWSAIALATPALWTAIRIDFPCASGLSRLVPIWFRRAKNHPLSITLGGDLSYLGSRVTTVIWKYGERLKHLEICEKEIHYEGNYSDSDDAEIDLFGDMTVTPGPLPLLETLTIRTEKGNRVPFSSDEILKLLRLAPNLVETNAAVVEQAVRRGRAVANPVLRAIPAQRRHVTQRGCLIASIAEGGLQVRAMSPFRHLRVLRICSSLSAFHTHPPALHLPRTPRAVTIASQAALALHLPALPYHPNGY
ncbi:hypothetical protein B0H14DRAFT_3425704 [Mycena olivaceomarginata]|nr:hypothetical protein B0H14DRAFT_3425704 [Mycena olivaceomarginata]